MKTSTKLLCVFSLLLFLLPACSSKEKAAESELYLIDISREAPVKEMILQDIAEVEYIRLETSDEMLWQGWSATAFSDRYILNYNNRTGDVLFFDRTGKGIRKINRQGGSGEEYSPYSGCLFDEEREEIYFNDRDKKKIFVYNLDGGFKRVFDYAPDKRYDELTLFDADRLIAYNDQYEETEANTYLILSKQTGTVEKEFAIPPIGQKLDARHLVQNGEDVMVYSFMTYPLTAAHPGFILADISNDTIFSMNQAMELTPLAIQKPSRLTMDPQVFLFYAKETRDYLFLYTVSKKLIGQGINARMEGDHLVYDKAAGQCYRQDIRNADFTSEKKVYISPGNRQLSASNKNVYLQVLNAGDLVEAYENNQLQGRLKEIAKDLDEEDNPVLLVARFK